MAKRKKKTKSPEEIATENELLKLKMMAEFGGNFTSIDEVPPEIEQQFLKQIISFHKKHEQSKMITVYNYIGRPAYNHANDLNDKEVIRDLNKLLKLMSRKGVMLSVLSETPKREVYRFVTEELFKIEVEDIKLKGWVNQFIYEEFHPNVEYDVRSAVYYCLQSIFNKGHTFFEDYFSDDLKDSIGLSTDTDELKEKIETFWAKFNNTKLEQYDVASSAIDKEAGVANVACNVSYKTQTEKGKRFKKETITIEFNLTRSKHMESWWDIQQIICDLL